MEVKHNTMSPARARSGVELTNHEATAAPYLIWKLPQVLKLIQDSKLKDRIKYNYITSCLITGKTKMLFIKVIKIEILS